MNSNDEQAGIQFFGVLIAVVLTALTFQYNVYTLCGKDVSFFLDLLAGLLIVWPKIAEFRFLAAISNILFIVCTIGRFVLDYPAPWIK